MDIGGVETLKYVDEGESIGKRNRGLRSEYSPHKGIWIYMEEKGYKRMRDRINFESSNLSLEVVSAEHSWEEWKAWQENNTW